MNCESMGCNNPAILGWGKQEVQLCLEHYKDAVRLLEAAGGFFSAARFFMDVGHIVFGGDPLCGPCLRLEHGHCSIPKEEKGLLFCCCKAEVIA